MRFNERQLLLSEVTVLEKMIAENPEEAVIDRRGIQDRLDFVRSKLSSDEHITASPVRYMVISNCRKVVLMVLGIHYCVIDTITTDLEPVCFTKTLEDAHRVARRMNHADGYNYHPDWGK